MATTLLPAMVMAGVLGLVGVGLYGLLVSRNLIKLLLVEQRIGFRARAREQAMTAHQEEATAYHRAPTRHRSKPERMSSKPALPSAKLVITMPAMLEPKSMNGIANGISLLICSGVAGMPPGPLTMTRMPPPRRWRA
jgi:hypothetical protein